MPSVTAHTGVAGGAVSSLTTGSFSPSGSDRLVLVASAAQGSDPSGASFNDGSVEALTFLDDHPGPFGLGTLSAYGEATASRPTAPATATATNTTGNTCSMSVAVLDGIDQTGPFGTFVTPVDGFSGDATFDVSITITGLSAGQWAHAEVQVFFSGGASGGFTPANADTEVYGYAASTEANAIATAVLIGESSGSSLTLAITVSNPDSAFAGYSVVGSPLVSAAGGGGTAVPVFGHHLKQQGIQ